MVRPTMRITKRKYRIGVVLRSRSPLLLAHLHARGLYNLDRYSWDDLQDLLNIGPWNLKRKSYKFVFTLKPKIYEKIESSVTQKRDCGSPNLLLASTMWPTLKPKSYQNASPTKNPNYL